MVAEGVGIPVIASGGGGSPDHLHEALTVGKADAALVASILHYKEFTVRDIKRALRERGIKVRLV
jgi:cyclase